MPPEFFDVVDDGDKVIGRRPGSECVRVGLLHRAIAVLLFDEWERVYIQRRAAGTTWYPGYWTLSVMGHVSSGETYEQAARREVKEELGLDCELSPVAKVKTPEWHYDGIVEQEYLAIFEGYITNQEIVLSDETEEGRFVSLGEFMRMAKEESPRLTPDTLLALDSYLESRGQRAGWS